MTEIAYCDNTNCIYNKEFICKNPEQVTLDENGTCCSAVYDRDKSLKKLEAMKKKEKKNISRIIKKNKWFGVV